MLEAETLHGPLRAKGWTWLLLGMLRAPRGPLPMSQGGLGGDCPHCPCTPCLDLHHGAIPAPGAEPTDVLQEQLLSSRGADSAAASTLWCTTCPLAPADVVTAPTRHRQGDRAVQRGKPSHPAPLEPAVLATAKQMWIRTAPNPAFTGTQPFCLFSILKAELITIFVSILISHVHIKAQLMFSLTSQAAVWMPKISKLSWRETRIKEKKQLR